MAPLSNRLSRWTLPLFAAALANFLAAQGLMLSGASWPWQSASADGTLATVHLLVIGWLLLLMLGALFQFVPVITSRALPSQRLVLATFIAIELGLAGMVCGFFSLGHSTALTLALPVGGSAVVLGVALALYNLSVPLLGTRALGLPGRMVLTGALFLALTVVLGLTFALAFAVPALTLDLAPLLYALGDHALAGLGGWFTLSAMGVSYKLLPMFMLAPEDRGLTGDVVHVLATLGFVLAIGAGLVRAWAAAPWLRVAQSSGEIAIVIAVAIFLGDILNLYRARQRALIETHNRAALGAFAMLGLTAVLAIGLLIAGRLAREAPLLVYLAVFGWLGGLGLTQLYKIVPFLTWLSRYGPRLGREAVPRVQDLVEESRGQPWFALYFLAVLLAGAALLLNDTRGLRAALALVALATLGLIREYWRAWRAYYPSRSRAHGVPRTSSPITEVDHG